MNDPGDSKQKRHRKRRIYLVAAISTLAVALVAPSFFRSLIYLSQDASQYGHVASIARSLDEYLDMHADALEKRKAVYLQFDASAYNWTNVDPPGGKSKTSLQDYWGRPLKFKMNDDGTVTVWSAGRDGTDRTSDDIAIPQP